VSLLCVLNLRPAANGRSAIECPIPPPASSPILRIGNTYGVSTGQREPQREPSPVADCSAIKTAIDGYCPTSPFLNSLGTRAICFVN